MTEVDLTNKEVEIMLEWGHIIYRTLLQQKRDSTVLRASEKLYKKLQDEWEQRGQADLFSIPWDGKDE